MSGVRVPHRPLPPDQVSANKRYSQSEARPTERSGTLQSTFCSLFRQPLGRNVRERLDAKRGGGRGFGEYAWVPVPSDGTGNDRSSSRNEIIEKSSEAPFISGELAWWRVRDHLVLLAARWVMTTALPRRSQQKTGPARDAGPVSIVVTAQRCFQPLKPSPPAQPRPWRSR